MFDAKKYMEKYNEKYYIKNKEKILRRAKQYCEDNLEKCRKNTRIWQKNNSERIKEVNKRWKENNIGRWEKYIKQYHENYPEKIRENHRICMNIMRKTNLKTNLNHRISGAIYKSIRKNKNGRRWETLVGYTLDKLKIHLRKTMPKGYNWQDFLKAKLHIDHIIPISAFNYNYPEHIDFKRCWALENLRLLPARENLMKHNKLGKPFQISLPIKC